MAGGFILFLFGVQMLFGKMDAKTEIARGGTRPRASPLAVPSIAGPGAMMAVIVLTDNDVYTVPQRIETGVVLCGGPLPLPYILLLFSECDSPGNRPAGCVRPRPCNGTHPLLSGSGNRADCARCRRLDESGPH